MLLCIIDKYLELLTLPCNGNWPHLRGKLQGIVNTRGGSGGKQPADDDVVNAGLEEQSRTVHADAVSGSKHSRTDASNRLIQVRVFKDDVRRSPT
ncbi:hypothetical protein D3C80_1808440 [compost metagenome]